MTAIPIIYQIQKYLILFYGFSLNWYELDGSVPGNNELKTVYDNERSVSWFLPVCWNWGIQYLIIIIMDKQNECKRDLLKCLMYME
jgi:hypothetical protein